MDTYIERLSDLFTETWSQVSTRFTDIVPDALLALFIVLVGWFVASVLQNVVLRIFRFFAIDKLVGKTPLERLVKDLGCRRGLTDMFGVLVFWLTILLTLSIVSDTLELSYASHALAVVTGYIPQVLASLLIIVLGMLLARFLQVLTIQAFKRVEIVGENVAGRIVYGIVLIFVIFAAIEQLDIGLGFITANVLIGIAALLVLLGIGLVLGSRSLIEGWVITQYLHHEVHIGDSIDIDGKRGEIIRMTHVAVVLKISDQEVTIPSKHFIEKGYTRFSSAA